MSYRSPSKYFWDCPQVFNHIPHIKTEMLLSGQNFSKTSLQLLTKIASKWLHFLFSEYKCGHRVIFASRIKNRDLRPISVFLDYKDVRWKTMILIIVLKFFMLYPAIMWEEDLIMKFWGCLWNVCWLRLVNHWCCNQYTVKYNPCFFFTSLVLNQI